MGLGYMSELLLKVEMNFWHEYYMYDEKRKKNK